MDKIIIEKNNLLIFHLHLAKKYAVILDKTVINKTLTTVIINEFINTFPAGTIRFSVSFFTSNDDFEDLKKALDYIDENL